MTPSCCEISCCVNNAVIANFRAQQPRLNPLSEREHDPLRWKEFQRRYKQELKQRQKEINELRTLARHSFITLIFAARDEEHNDAVVLRDFLLRQ